MNEEIKKMQKMTNAQIIAKAKEALKYCREHNLISLEEMKMLQGNPKELMATVLNRMTLHKRKQQS